jgi:hypothetical protein
MLLLGTRTAGPRGQGGKAALEDALVRRSVGALGSGRVECRDCHRTPLTGEIVYAYGQKFVCELCRPRHRAAPDAQVPVRSPEHAIVVRRLRPDEV